MRIGCTKFLLSIGQTYVVTVKAVTSGDTLILLNSANGELPVHLSGIRAPGLSRHPEHVDEPLGYLAREMLRKLTIGRTVFVRMDYSTLRNNVERKCVTLWLKTEDTPPPQDMFKSINNIMVIAGLANPFIPNDMNRGSFSPQDAEVLKTSLEIARRDSKGIHANVKDYENQGKRNLLWVKTQTEGDNCLDDLRNRTGSSNSVTVPAVIETVLSGNTYRVFIPLNNTMLVVTLAGTYCPGTSKPAPTTTSSSSSNSSSSSSSSNTNAASVAANGRPQMVPDPLGTEIFGVADRSFLHREVMLSLYAIDDKGKGIGSLSENSAGDIGLFLISHGYARIFNHTEKYVPVELLGQYRAVERQAQTKKLGLFVNFEDRVPPVNPNAESFKGQVVEIHSGDTITVLVNPHRNIYKDAAVERRISLSSIMAPLAQSKDPNRPSNPKAADAAKEYLRAKYIGKMVQVDVDYTRESNQQRNTTINDDNNSVSTVAPTRTFGTVVYTTNKGEPVDLGEDLLTQGLGSLMMHRQGDRRSRRYDSLQQAFTQAKTGGRGMHSSKNSSGGGSTPGIDTISSKQEADKRFEYLRRELTMKGIVEAVMNTGRIRILLPEQYCRINFGISAIKCPNSGERSTEPELMGPEGKSYARQILMQKQVEIRVERLDPTGRFLGTLWVGEGGQRFNYGVDILRKGFGYLIRSVVKNIQDSEELVKAEEEAIAKVTGGWVSWKDELQESEETNNNGGGRSLVNAPGSNVSIPLLPPSSTVDSSNVSSSTVQYVTSPTLAGTAWNTPTKTSLIGSQFNAFVTYVQNHNSFYINKESDEARLNEVYDHLDALYDQYGANHAPLGGLPEAGKVIACITHDKEGNPMWTRGRIEGPVKDAKGVNSTVNGLTEYNVIFIDVGERVKATVHQMRPLDAGIAVIPPLAIECGFPYLRYPQEFINDVTDNLKDCVLGRFKCIVYDQKDNNKRLLVDLIDDKDENSSVSIPTFLVKAGYVRLSRTETNSIKLKAGIGRNHLRIVSVMRRTVDFSTIIDGTTKAQLNFILQIEEGQQEALKNHAGMWEFGDVGDTDTEDRAPGTSNASSSSGKRGNK